jgi:alpha-L-glutamate ligase-like protein
MMTFKGISGLWNAGVLGMNRRNAEYIMRCNPRSSYPLVDNKLYTKTLAEKHRIPTPALYHVVEYHGDIAGLEHALRDRRNFVLKPARGAGGSGIVLVTDREGRGFVTQSGEVMTWSDFSYHISDILSGIYSLAALEDEAIIEALVFPDPAFVSVSYEGVPDIRIVVYQGVPVMGMVRLPTKESEGKANLHRGAVGSGIEMSRGLTLDAVHGSETITRHPDTGRQVRGIEVPHWRAMLLMAASAFEMTGLGYVGVDMVIDRKRGPLLLEINVRPGLAIQLANGSGLRRRLDLVDRAPSQIFATAETRAQWAMETFSSSLVSEGLDGV